MRVVSIRLDVRIRAFVYVYIGTHLRLSCLCVHISARHAQRRNSVDTDLEPTLEPCAAVPASMRHGIRLFRSSSSWTGQTVGTLSWCCSGSCFCLVQDFDSLCGCWCRIIDVWILSPLGFESGQLTMCHVALCSVLKPQAPLLAWGAGGGGG